MKLLILIFFIFNKLQQNGIEYKIRKKNIEAYSAYILIVI